jgi:N-acyl-D-aspartate/D-glutamate deacylase
MSELEELKLAYAECSRQRNELLNKLKSQAQRKPLTDEEKRELIKKSELWDMHVHIGWYSAPSKSFVEKAIQLIAAIEAAHNIKENT